MVGVEGDPVEKIVGQDLPLILCGLFPQLFDVQVGQVPGHVLEGLGGFVAVFELLLQLGDPGFEGVDLGGESGFLFGEEAGADGSPVGTASADTPAVAVVRLLR